MRLGGLLGRVLEELALVAAGLAIGLAAAAVVAWLYGAPPLGVLETLFSSVTRMPDLVAEYTAVLTLTGLSFALPLYTGLFNIGAEGGVYLGALVGLYVALATGSLVLSLLAGALAGAALLLFAGWLRVRLRVNEVLSTIMLNWAVYWVMLYIVVTRLIDPMFPQMTRPVPESARLPYIGLGGAQIPSTIIIAAVFAALTWVAVRMTRHGLLMRVSGSNPEAARLRGVSSRLYMLASMAAAGLAAGLGGALHVDGYAHSIDVLGNTVYGYGYNGIGVALVGRNDPLGVLASAFFFATMMAGAQLVEPRYGIPRVAADLIVGVIVVALAAPEALRALGRLRARLLAREAGARAPGR